MTFKRLTNRLDFFNRHYDLLVYDNHILIRYKPLFKKVYIYRFFDSKGKETSFEEVYERMGDCYAEKD